VLVGGAGNDVLRGEAGDDVLNSGAGRDTMQGGAGKDRFRFEARSTGGRQLDLIRDFKPKQDVIEISRSLLPGSRLKAGELKANDFQIVRGIRNADDASAKILYDRRSGIVYYNPNRGVEVPLFQMQKNLNVSASDFRIF
jgi:Ca2+-binding RTX toxin-like protein